jgi:hypothetical protein
MRRIAERNKANDGDNDHRQGDISECVQIAPEQRIVNQQAGNIWLRQPHRGGEKPQKHDGKQSSPIGSDIGQGPLVLPVWNGAGMFRSRQRAGLSFQEK